ncbi:MAG: hypothetical protein KGS48_14095 [Bacteroidetes bacterium]|nr:hypothetical protein [Bacteroidota bacterium]
MINSNLLEILQTFSKDQLCSFQEYFTWLMRDQAFERNEALQLLEIIIDYYPNLQHEGLQKEAVFAQMFPQKAFVERKIDKIMVNLSKGLRSFQLHQHYLQPENEFHQLLDILQVYKAKGMVARYQQGFKQLEAYMKENQKQSLKAVFEFYQFQYEKLDWNSLNNNQRSDLDLPGIIQSFEDYHQINLHDFLNRYLLQQKLVKLSPPPFLETLLSDAFQQKTIEKPALLFVYQYILKLLYKTDIKVEEFNFILNYLKENESLFDEHTLQSFYTYLRNICIILINNGHAQFTYTMFRLLKTNVELGHIFYKGKITSSAFVNAVTMALQVKETAWAYHFLENYKDVMLGESPDRAYYRLCRSNYYFAMQDYERATEQLPLSMPEVKFTLIARRLELKAYYELKSNLTGFKIETFRIFVLRLPQKNLPPDTVAFNANFTSILSQLLNSRQGDRDRGIKLLQRISEKRFISEREWLIEKACALGDISPVEAAEIIKNTPVEV